MAQFRLKLRIQQIISITKLLIGWTLAKCSRKEKELWLFCERGTDAQDNGYWMFKYVKENHPEINAKYLITSSSPDRKLLATWKDDIIEYGTCKHYSFFWQAKHLISTHIHGYLPVCIRCGNKKIKRFIEKRNKARVTWLQHGVIKNDHPSVHYGKAFLDLFICGALPEYQFINEHFGYPDGIVAYTGLARFDGLHDVQTDHRQILIMPTWRQWLKRGGVTGSQFLETYQALLSNKRLQNFLIKNNLQLVFYPHHELQPFISKFSQIDLPSNITIADEEHFNVQQLLKESALLITDYSSVFFDFAYMRKPIVYFQFDEAKFIKEHYAKGYYDYHDGLGEWTDNIDDLVDAIVRLAHDEFKMPEKYKNKVNEFFPLNDTNNCERIYKAIGNLNRHP